MPSHPASWFTVGRTVHVRDKMQSRYSYTLDQPYGRIEDPDFRPELTPLQMLHLGVFEGKYLNDCRDEFPKEWFQGARLSPEHADPSMNLFKIKSRLSLPEWERRKWIIQPDVRGWFQWYCRYYIGRRIPEVDRVQIQRWKAFVRHRGQIKKNCAPHDLHCRPKQRQALLQWAYNPFI